MMKSKMKSQTLNFQSHYLRQINSIKNINLRLFWQRNCWTTWSFCSEKLWISQF